MSEEGDLEIPRSPEACLGEIQSFIKAHNSRRERKGITDMLSLIELRLVLDALYQAQGDLLNKYSPLQPGKTQGEDLFDNEEYIAERESLIDRRQETQDQIRSRQEAMAQKSNSHLTGGKYRIASEAISQYHRNLSLSYELEDGMPSMAARRIALQRMTTLINPPLQPNSPRHS